jgi:predicted molibdopterin-dependent oxidoreductase YjgC
MAKPIFTPVSHQPPKEEPSLNFPLIMTTGRMVAHYNSGALSRNIPPLSRYAPSLWVEINPQDAEEMGLVEGERVRISLTQGRSGGNRCG